MQCVDIIPDEGEDLISKPRRPIELNRYPEISLETTWELANLIRIAARDYQCFNNWFNTKKGSENLILEADRKLENVSSNNNWIYVSKSTSQSVLDKYVLLSEAETKDASTLSKFPDTDYYKYKVIKTYEYVSYYFLPNKSMVDIDRFGFIAERLEGNQKIVFVVFRGTREPSEWFSNGQFQQVNFLQTESRQEGVEGFGKVSLGFNKMYADFRPGILMNDEHKNYITRKISEKARELAEKVAKITIKEQTIATAVDDYFSKPQSTDTSVYITGHSLGAALATIAAADIARRNNITSPIYLYTFASPRVGDNNFGDRFNKFIDEGRIKAFRFANTEDLVPNIPFPVWFKSGLDLEQQLILSLTQSLFNKFTGGIFEKDYQHVGIPIYFTHQARRIDSQGNFEETATVGDNHNLTVTYCGALPGK